MTRLAAILSERNLTYISVATRAQVQARTIRQLATGETPMDQATVGTLRKIAFALSIPVGSLLENDQPLPGDPSMTRTERLSLALRNLAQPVMPVAFVSPVERLERDEIAVEPPDEFFAHMALLHADRG